MFKCPKCNNSIYNNKCIKCNYEIKIINGVMFFTNEDNINLDEDNKYIGYDDINLDFDPAIIYYGEDSYGIYGACGEDIANRFSKEIVVLDLGCGLGSACIPLANAGVKTIGIDISKEMLFYTNKRSKGNLDNLILCKMNAYNLLLEDESIDIVIENAMIHLVDNPEAVYKEIYRVLKPNGKLIHYKTVGCNTTEEQKELSRKCNEAVNDISDFYYNTLKEHGYIPNVFNNNSLEFENKYFNLLNTEEYNIVLDYEEEFTDKMKFRMHRLEHKAHSDLQHIPNEIHKLVWDKTNLYAISKYGFNYKDMQCYFKYHAAYCILMKK